METPSQQFGSGHGIAAGLYIRPRQIADTCCFVLP
jgi:hypothetical protein